MLLHLRAIGRKFVLQGGTHRNLAVVKAQVDFITSKIPDAEIMIHPYTGEADAISAALSKPAESVKIRVETIAYYMERSSASIIKSKKEHRPDPLPLLQAGAGRVPHCGLVPRA